MEFVGKAISTNLNGIRGQGHFSREFVGKAISDQFNGIRRQCHFGPTLMEFVGKAIFLGPSLMEFVGKAIFGPGPFRARPFFSDQP